MSRIIIAAQPFSDRTPAYWFQTGDWPALWVDHPKRPLGAPSVALFRLVFEAHAPATVRIHATADNRYRLTLDGRPVGSGPERCDPAHWSFESYELSLTAGRHVFAAMSWWQGDVAPQAQMTVRPGFLLAADGDWTARLSTGLAPWQTMLAEGIEHLPPHDSVYGTGARVRLHGARYPWGWETGDVAGEWQPVACFGPGMTAALKTQYHVPSRLLTPATLPAMRADRRKAGVLRYLTNGEQTYPVRRARHLAGEEHAWAAWLAGAGTVTVPARTVRRAIVDLEDYYCAYPALRVSGGQGATIALKWAEALYTDRDSHAKGHRDEIEGKTFVGYGDEFLPDGRAEREYVPLWWMSGRYLELTVTAVEEPVTLTALDLVETGYPLRWEGDFECSDERLPRIAAIGWRALQMCSHETYMDCPHYEQMMYAGDGRLEVLTTYVTTRDDRLPRKALAMFDASRRLDGLSCSQHPSRIVQVIPPFALWWVGMVHDFWMWRDDPAFVRRLMPGVRATMEVYHGLIRPDGLLNPPHGWNFTDWVPGWTDGVPPGARERPSGVLSLHAALALQYKAELETFCGDTLLAERDRAAARALSEAVTARCWREDRGLLADAPDAGSFSEHAQCLAILGGQLDRRRLTRVVEGLLTDSQLTRTTVYFSHYLFEALYLVGKLEHLFDRLSVWHYQLDHGFRTTCEKPEPSRSDCHAWGAHPLYHFYASVLGIRPACPGFRRVRIAPALGPLTWARGAMPHPSGEIRVALRETDGRMFADLALPAGIDGAFVWAGQEFEVAGGRPTRIVAG
ncbi:MAG: alpha-L-rhamnosidase C-terminal domain-containing protein [Kiritimatiellae bacterium]|nr:alpha-L-rhamnosidase C-terminal domain-containing protein [Kiritimatiellia bacterium]